MKGEFSSTRVSWIGYIKLASAVERDGERELFDGDSWASVGFWGDQSVGGTGTSWFSRLWCRGISSLVADE